ncbi:MAG: hypothetical protein GEV05_24385 [Betaproteobacteria bacterium]|nr:hypothetical protein [Betaproteobacteria bacterium]
MKIGRGVAMLLAGGSVFAAEQNVALKDVPFPVPAGARVTVEDKAINGQQMRIFIVHQKAPAPHVPKGSHFAPEDFERGFLAGRELGKCQQRVTSRQGWSATQPNNFIQITGNCVGHSFAYPASAGKREADGLPCQADVRDQTVTVLNCVVDGVEVAAFSFSTDCCPSSRSVWAIRRQ